jgi:hypothetical protein
MKTLAVLFLLAFALPVHAADYGVKTRFKMGEPLVFSDLELVFTGTRHESSPVYRNGFLLYDFTARSSKDRKSFSWSAGTGLIAPRFFTVHGREFVLELKRSRSLKGWMKEDELVLWKKADFEKLPP